MPDTNTTSSEIKSFCPCPEGALLKYCCCNKYGENCLETNSSYSSQCSCCSEAIKKSRKQRQNDKESKKWQSKVCNSESEDSSSFCSCKMARVCETCPSNALLEASKCFQITSKSEAKNRGDDISKDGSEFCHCPEGTLLRFCCCHVSDEDSARSVKSSGSYGQRAEKLKISENTGVNQRKVFDTRMSSSKGKVRACTCTIETLCENCLRGALHEPSKTFHEPSKPATTSVKDTRVKFGGAGDLLIPAAKKYDYIYLGVASGYTGHIPDDISIIAKNRTKSSRANYIEHWKRMDVLK